MEIDIYKNPFVKTIIGLSKIVITKAEILETKHVPTYKKYNELTVFEKHIMDIMHDNSSLLGALADIELISVFLRRFPQRKYFHENNVTELDYIRLQLEIFVSKVYTISELIKHITNKVYELDLSERQCSSKNIKAKLGENMPIIIYIDGFDQATKPYSSRRIRVTHKGTFSADSTFEDLSLFSTYLKYTDLLKDESVNSILSQSSLNSMFKNYRKEQANKIIQDISGIKHFIDKFYTLWNEQLKEWVSKNNIQLL